MHNSIIFLHIELVLTIHEKEIDAWGGQHGVRDMGLLESAVNMPQSSFGGAYLYNNIHAMAAAYMFYIIKNHAFIDGNKRTGLACALIFLEANQICVTLSHEDAFDYTIDVAIDRISIDKLAEVLKNNSIIENA